MTDSKTEMERFMRKLRDGVFDSMYKNSFLNEEEFRKKYMLISDYNEIDLYKILTNSGCSNAQINQILKIHEEKIPLFLYNAINKTPQELRKIRKMYNKN